MATAFTTIPLPGPVSLQVRLGRGSLRIAARADAVEATVRLAPRSGSTALLDRVEVGLRGRTVVVTGPRQGGLADILHAWVDDREGIDADIEVPEGTRISVVSASDEITLTGRCGDVDIATAAARISVETVAGDLRLRHGHAECSVGTVTGAVRLSAGSGDTHLAEVGGVFTGRLGRGDLDLEVARGDVHARTGSGAVRLAAVYGNLDVATGHGQMDIGIPAGVSARLDAVTGLGRVVSELPVDQAPARGAASITIRARTGRGDITLQRATAA